VPCQVVVGICYFGALASAHFQQQVFPVVQGDRHFVVGSILVQVGAVLGYYQTELAAVLGRQLLAQDDVRNFDWLVVCCLIGLLLRMFVVLRSYNFCLCSVITN
jgi:hypothetical protein